MTDLKALQATIAEERERLRATLPGDRWTTIGALVCVGDGLRVATAGLPTWTDMPEVPTRMAEKQRLCRLGWNSALALCLRQDGRDTGEFIEAENLAAWAEKLLLDCGRLAEAEQAAASVETGYLQVQQEGESAFAAWATTKRMPTEWREREDFAWWSAMLARQTETGRLALLRDRPTAKPRDEWFEEQYTSHTAEDAYYQRLGDAETARMACQHSYPSEGVVGGHPFHLYSAALARLIGWMLQRLNQGEESATPVNLAALGVIRSTEAIVAALAVALESEASVARDILDCLTLTAENAAYHAALPGAAAPPCIRVDEDHLVWSVAGLLGEPFVFLTRELRRRDAQGYHNTAHLREGVFRRDLYELFADKRFVTSAGRVELRREGGNARTDLDAIIFDRKTGTLGIFELKAQDPFARTAAERLRQRDNFYHANTQVAGALHWIKQHGADALLARVDQAVAKRFRTQRVHFFVLGRYLAHYADGPEPDRRAAWGTWPQVLKFVEGPLRLGDANPLSALFNALQRDTPLAGPVGEQETHEIPLGAGHLRIYPSFARYRDGGD